MRDISKSEFDRKTAEYGFKPQGFMGYYSLPEPFENCSVSVLNAGNRCRDRLAYLLAELHKHKESKGKETI